MKKQEIIKVQTSKESFSITRMIALDDKQKNPDRNYYTSSDGDLIYYIDSNGYLFQEIVNENGEYWVKSFRPSNTTLKQVI